MDSKISELTAGVPTDTDIIPFVDLATGTTKKAVKTDLIGAQGPQGFQGPQGPQGAQGFQGNQGSQGYQGSQGSQGFQGPQGSPNGPQGPQGYQGPQGTQGFQGIIGTQGTQGFQGPQGIIGTQGTQGYQGPQGLVGGTFTSRVRAYLSADLAIPFDTYTKINLDTESFDGLSEWDTTNYQFSASVAGYYQINGQIAYLYDHTTSGCSYGVSLNRGGTRILENITDVPVSNIHRVYPIMSDVVYLTASQVLNMYGYTTRSTGTSAVQDLTCTYLSIHRLS
jgi:hypothetical protein